MTNELDSIASYIAQAPTERHEALYKLTDIFKKNLPEGFREELNYGMIGYVVPHELYPKGYHCNKSLPLPFINIASQKNFIAVYHMGIYAKPELLEWFQTEYPKHSKLKLDMGKSCIRFKKIDQIPYELFAQLAQKMTVADWINTYEHNFTK